MSRILIFGGMTLGSWIGWMAGERMEGVTTALVLSGVLACAGAYGGWKAAREWLG